MSTDLKDVSTYSTILKIKKKEIYVRWWGAPLEELIPMLKADAKQQILEELKLDSSACKGDLRYEDDRGNDLHGEWRLRV